MGRRLTAANLGALRRIGFQANRRLLDVERLSHDCALGDAAFAQIHRPVVVDKQRAAALRFSEPRVQALLSALVCFRRLPRGFSHAELRAHLAPLLGVAEDTLTSGRMTYDLRRLRLHRFITRLPKTHRYRVSDFGLHAALFATRSYARLLRPGLALVLADEARSHLPLRNAFRKLECEMDAFCAAQRLSP